MINEVLDVMVELAQEGMTMMCVTHEMGFAKKVAHRVIFMDQGLIVEDDRKEDFFANPKSDRAKDFLAKICTEVDTLDGAVCSRKPLRRKRLFLGSSRITGECGADFEEEVFLVAVPVSTTLDDLDGVVDALDNAGIEWVSTAREDACQAS